MKYSTLTVLLSSAVACLGANISGTISYPGSQTGPIRVTVNQSVSGNQVLKLSGAGTVSLDSLTSLAGPELTIQFWFKGSTVQSAVRQQTGGYIIAGYNNGHLTLTDGFLAGAANGVTDGNWHHIIMTRKRANALAGYVDGQLKGTIAAADSDLPNLGGPVYFGSLANLGEYTIGELDEIAIWNRALSASEISTNWGLPIATNAPGLLGYWKFDDGTFNDATTNGYNGTPIGDATIVSDSIPAYTKTVVISNPGPYTITGVPLGSGFSVTAFMDASGDGIRQPNEPSGAYAANPFTLAGDQSGVNITLTEPPYITVQPQTPPGGRVAAGASVSFSVTALGTAALSYQWYRDTTALANDARISGAQSPNLQITGLVAGDAGGYSCVVSNAIGSATSQAPQLYVITTGQSISGNFTYNGSQTGLVHSTVAQLRPNNKVLNLSRTPTNFALTTLTDLSGDALSIEYWFKGSGLYSAVRQQGAAGYIVAGWGSGLHILSNDGGTSGVKVSNPPGLVTDGNWHHVAMTWQRNTVNGFASYLDGELVDERNSADAPIPDIGAGVYFGSFGGAYEFLNGMLDEIAIWGVALTRTEIRLHARNGLTGSEPGLKGYWNFDDGLGKDLTGNGNDAELSNGATIDPASIPGQGAVYTDVFPSVGAYTISAIPSGTNYSLFAFLDANGNGAQDPTEPWGAYAGNPFNLPAPLTGANILLYDPPSFSTNPVSITVLEGGTISLGGLSTGGTSNRYQWLYYSTPLVDGGRVSGSQSNVLTITGAQLTDAGAYSLVATNPGGTGTSLAAAVIVQPAGLTNQLVAYWKFDDGTGGVAQEATGLSQAGTLYNFPTDNSGWVTGIIAGALKFSEAGSNYVIASDYVKATNTMTVSVWAWADTRPSWASIAKNWGDAQYGQFHLGLVGDTGQLGNYIADGSGTSFSALDPAVFPVGSWQHVAFVADGARMRLYRNGLEVASSAQYNGTLLFPLMAGLGVGVKTDDSGTNPSLTLPGYWNGKLDDLGIWTRALSPSEIFGLYRGGLSGKGIAQASAVQPVTLSITLNGTQVTIYYPAGTLQWADQPAGTWSGVPGASPPSFTTTATQAKFFRVR